MTIKYFLLLLLVPFNLSAKIITDMAGRNVEVPETIERILPYDSKAELLMFPVVSDLLVAKAHMPGNREYSYISAAYTELPKVDIKNVEEVLMCQAQVIIASYYKSTTNFDNFEKLQQRTKIPVIMLDMSLDNLDESYHFLGELLGREEACALRAQFIQGIYDTTNRLLNEKDAIEHSIYYTIGKTGLMTDPSGSKHSEVIDFLQLNNVAKIAIPTGGHAKVNMEQVIIWNPDYIFCAGFRGGKSSADLIKSDSKWQTVDAVKQGNVYNVPTLPFGWFDNPPSINRLPGIIWLSELFYGQDAVLTKDLITEFYFLFYNYRLTDNDYQALFQ